MLKLYFAKFKNVIFVADWNDTNLAEILWKNWPKISTN